MNTMQVRGGGLPKAGVLKKLGQKNYSGLVTHALNQVVPSLRNRGYKDSVIVLPILLILMSLCLVKTAIVHSSFPLKNSNIGMRC